MAQFLRGKQAGIQKDLSEGLSPDLFLLDDVSSWHPRHLFSSTDTAVLSLHDVV